MNDIHAGQVGDTFNIHSKSRDERSRLLSNFANRPFEIDDYWMASVEGFIQGIKFPPRDRRRYQAFASSGGFAKKIGAGVRHSLVWFVKEHRHGGYIAASAGYGSDQHHGYIAWAIVQKFDQNPDCMEALLATKGLRLTHDTGEPESPHTSLPAELFCEILTDLRENKLRYG